MVCSCPTGLRPTTANINQAPAFARAFPPQHWQRCVLFRILPRPGTSSLNRQYVVRSFYRVNHRQHRRYGDRSTPSSAPASRNTSTDLFLPLCSQRANPDRSGQRWTGLPTKQQRHARPRPEHQSQVVRPIPTNMQSDLP